MKIHYIYEFTRTGKPIDTLPRHIGYTQENIHSVWLEIMRKGSLEGKSSSQLGLQDLGPFQVREWNELEILGLRNTLYKGKTHGVFEEELILFCWRIKHEGGSGWLWSIEVRRYQLITHIEEVIRTLVGCKQEKFLIVHTSPFVVFWQYKF